jgi:hypothetical protein
LDEEMQEAAAVKRALEDAMIVERGFPARFKLWQLFFAHRDYFWRLGLCVPGGDPADWGRGPYNMTMGAFHDDL